MRPISAAPKKSCEEKFHFPSVAMYSTFSAVAFCEEQQLIVCCANEKLRAKNKIESDAIIFFIREIGFNEVSGSEGNTVPRKLRPNF